MNLIVEAKLEHKPQFALLWLDFLAEDQQNTKIIPTARTMNHYLSLWEQVVKKEIRGNALFAVRDGGFIATLLQSELRGEFPFDTERKHQVFAWGSYVVPKWRSRGICGALWDHALDSLRFQGIENLALEIQVDHKATLKIDKKRGKLYGKERGVIYSRLVGNINLEQEH